MSTTRKTISAKSGKTPTNEFNSNEPHTVLEGVGRLQKRGITYTLFEMDSDVTIPFVVVRGDKRGVKYIAGGIHFTGAGKPVAGAVARADARRAHDDDGKFAADDPATPDTNEAFEGGKAPAKKKKSTKKKSAKKKKAPTADDMGI